MTLPENEPHAARRVRCFLVLVRLGLVGGFERGFLVGTQAQLRRRSQPQEHRFLSMQSDPTARSIERDRSSGVVLKEGATGVPADRSGARKMRAG